MSDKLPDASKSWRLEDLKHICGSASEQRAGQLLRFFKPAAARTEPGYLEDLIRSNPAAHLLGQRGSVLTFRAPRLEQLPRLPRGYAFKGGAARIALQALCGEPLAKLRPRDIDVIRFGTAATPTDVRVAQSLMPEDWKHGHGVELLTSEQTYFATRDLTVNEVYLTSQQLITTERALKDTIARTLRLTTYALSQDGRAQGKLLLKMIRLSVEAGAGGKCWTIEERPPAPEIFDFDVRLNLRKAAQVSAELEQALAAEYSKLASN